MAERPVYRKERGGIVNGDGGGPLKVCPAFEGDTGTIPKPVGNGSQVVRGLARSARRPLFGAPDGRTARPKAEGNRCCYWGSFAQRP